MRLDIGSTIVAVALVFALYSLYVILAGLGFDPIGVRWDFALSGQLGDSFGPLNSLMAAVAAIGAIAAYMSQREELNRVKKERDRELATADKRDFESTFFNLLTLLRTTVQEIDIPDRYGGQLVAGRDAIRRVLSTHIGGPSGNPENDRKRYRLIYSQYQDDLGHYFRLFYHVLKYIDDSGLENKTLYVRLLRATLSNAEMVLIGLNCMYGAGRSKLKPLLEKYAVLHNISASEAQAWFITSDFAQSAFGDRHMTTEATHDPERGEF